MPENKLISELNIRKLTEEETILLQRDKKGNTNYYKQVKYKERNQKLHTIHIWYLLLS